MSGNEIMKHVAVNDQSPFDVIKKLILTNDKTGNTSDISKLDYCITITIIGILWNLRKNIFLVSWWAKKKKMESTVFSNNITVRSKKERGNLFQRHTWSILSVFCFGGGLRICWYWH